MIGGGGSESGQRWNWDGDGGRKESCQPQALAGLCPAELELELEGGVESVRSTRQILALMDMGYRLGRLLFRDEHTEW